MIAILASAVIAAAPADAAAIDRQIRASFAAAQALQGPLDGGWTVLDARERPLFRLQIADPPSRRPRLEGAWSAVAGPGATPSSGRLEMVRRGASALRVRLLEGPGTVDLELRRLAGGRWSGWMANGRRRRRVTLARESP